ncbi:MAG TPA: HD domain-containing protein [Syntrophomonadaceae bacterium]|nr:HD domain-containing protein [Syntrophomonadaceae bacterium]HPR92708.1 HD domain-containing protein [Syntrophomonadaceae bacterium]
MISKEMLELLFRPASIQRWNDHIRPHTGFSELDKQAHKMVFAYVLARTEEDEPGNVIDWQQLIEGGLFEFLQRSILTDLKPDIFHQLMEQKSYELNAWVIEQLQPSVESIKGDFWQKLNDYFGTPEYSAKEKRILKAAHYLATSWEFNIIQHMNKGIYGLEETRSNIANEVEEFYDLSGVQKYVLGMKNRNFMDLVGQLRFQQRWAQSPRVPQTSVLGHMLIVAVLTYLFSLETEACRSRIYNNYFAGLFHDLPEVLTRDIVSPVKRAVEGLEAIIKEIEKIQFDEKILPLLPREWHQEMMYFLQDEFQNKMIVDGKVQICSAEGISREYNQDWYSPLDGELVRACDQLAAYIEASLSIIYGIKAPDLLRGKEQIYSRYADTKFLGIDFKTYFDYFRTD